MNRIKGIFVLLAGLCIFLAQNSTLFAATIFVDATNISGIEDGSLSYPFANIQPAVDASIPGDTVSVAPGIYYEHVSLKSHVDLVSQQGPESTIIEPGGNWSGVVGPDLTETVVDCYIEGFTLRGTSIGIYAQNYASYWGQARWEVVNCIFPGFTWTGILIFPGAELNIRDSLFVDTYLDLQFVWGRGGYVENNTFVRAANYAMSSVYTNVTLINNTISDAPRVFYFQRGGQFSGTNNNIWNYDTLVVQGSPAGTLSLTNTLNVDPSFVDAENSDFHLSSFSPLIDAGAVIAGRDYAGAAPDIGAYEYSLTVPERISELAESFYDIPDEAMKNNADNRKNAINNKFASVLNDLAKVDPNLPAEEQALALRKIVEKLENDLMAKADGFYGGNPKNDWITSEVEQAQVYPVLLQLVNDLKQQITELGG